MNYVAGCPNSQDTLMGETRKPKMSAGIMVLEPDSKKNPGRNLVSLTCVESAMRTRLSVKMFLWYLECIVCGSVCIVAWLVRFDTIMERSSAVLEGQKKSYFLEQDVLNAFFSQTYNILPMTYNLYPELLDLMPFLHVVQDSGTNASMWPSLELPMDNSIKVVHFWHLFNPFQITKYKGAHNLQVNAKRTHKQMWRWQPDF